MCREAGATIAIPHLAQIAAEGKDADAVRAAQVLLDKALPTHPVPEGERTQFVIVMPPRAKATEEWLRLHGLGQT
jgi:hypothetical protein